MMGAGNASSSLYKCNPNEPTGGGNKKQGISPRVGLNNWSNREVQTQSNGLGRFRLVFQNQLGGVGAGNSMFGGQWNRADGLSKTLEEKQLEITIKQDENNGVIIPLEKRIVRSNQVIVGGSNQVIVEGFKFLPDQIDYRMYFYRDGFDSTPRCVDLSEDITKVEWRIEKDGNTINEGTHKFNNTTNLKDFSFYYDSATNEKKSGYKCDVTFPKTIYFSIPIGITDQAQYVEGNLYVFRFILDNGTIYKFDAYFEFG